jgi:hypothetical protein
VAPRPAGLGKQAAVPIRDIETGPAFRAGRRRACCIAVTTTIVAAVGRILIRRYRRIVAPNQTPPDLAEPA